jgi:protein-S-isoprenylcysteine O-methyltransferase Ste14
MTENDYRVMLLAIMALFMPVGLYFRLRSLTGERLVRRDEGLLIMLTLRLCGLGMMLGLLAYLINPSLVEWSQLGLPGSLRALGLPLGLAAVAWLLWMLRTLGPNLTDTVTVRKNASLVTGGPYRWVRHPMYMGVASLVLAASLITGNLVIALLGTGTVAMQVLRVPTEEAKLVERFGDAYRDYASRTGRFFPRLGAHRGT